MYHDVVIRGDRALFARPDCTDPLSFPIPPPSAIRGVLEAVYWHPGMYIDTLSIAVLNPIQWDREGIIEIRGSKQTGENGAALPKFDPRKKLFHEPTPYTRVTTCVVLRDPAWLVRFRICRRSYGHPDAEQTNERLWQQKADDMMHRRIERGQSYAVPFLGVARYRASISVPRGEVPIESSRDFGMMIHDIDYRPKVPVQHVFHARMTDGVVVVPSFFDTVLCAERKAA